MNNVTIYDYFEFAFLTWPQEYCPFNISRSGYSCEIPLLPRMQNCNPNIRISLGCSDVNEFMI